MLHRHTGQDFFTNMWINIVKTKYNFFRFFQVYEFVNQSTKHGSSSLSYKAFEKVVKCAITKLKSDGFQGLCIIFCVATIRLSRLLLIKKSLHLKARPAEARLLLNLEHAQKELCMPRVESPFSSQFFQEDRRSLCSQGTRSLKLDHFKIDHGLSLFPSPQSPQSFCCCCFFFSLCTTFKRCVFGGEFKNGSVISDHVDFSPPKLKPNIKKKDHLPWTTACPLAPRDEKNRGKKQQTALILASVRIRIVLFLFERQSSLEQNPPQDSKIISQNLKPKLINRLFLKLLGKKTGLSRHYIRTKNKKSKGLKTVYECKQMTYMESESLHFSEEKKF